MSAPYQANINSCFDVTCHHQDYIQFCGPACLMMLINHLKNSNIAETSEVELYKKILAHPKAGQYGMKAPPQPMLCVLNTRVDNPAKAYKIIWGKSATTMAERVVNSILLNCGPVLVPVKDKNHWVLFHRAETDAQGKLKFVGMRNPVTIGAPEFDPTGPEHNHSPGPDPCNHDQPHIQEQFLDVEGLLVLLKPTQWEFQVFRNLAIVPVAVPDLDLAKDEVNSGSNASRPKGAPKSAIKIKAVPAKRGSRTG